MLLIIGDYIKSRLAILDQDRTDKYIEDHYHNLGYDLSKPVNLDQLYQLIDSIVDSLQSNLFLTTFLNKIAIPNISDDDLFYIVTYASVLNSLIDIYLTEIDIFITIYQKWSDQKFTKIAKRYGILGSIKYYSIKKGLDSNIKAIKTNQISKSHGKYILPINIIEIVIYQFFKGNRYNSKVGLYLAKNCSNLETPTINNNMVQLKYSNPIIWNDLYQSWDLAFVMSLNNPLLIVKLIIPLVSNYRNDPESYIYKRLLALFTTINYQNPRIISLFDSKIINLFSKSNYDMMKNL